jgi:hypothetical protein
VRTIVSQELKEEPRQPFLLPRRAQDQHPLAASSSSQTASRMRCPSSLWRMRSVSEARRSKLQDGGIRRRLHAQGRHAVQEAAEHRVLEKKAVNVLAAVGAVLVEPEHALDHEAHEAFSLELVLRLFRRRGTGGLRSRPEAVSHAQPHSRACPGAQSRSAGRGSCEEQGRCGHSSGCLRPLSAGRSASAPDRRRAPRSCPDPLPPPDEHGTRLIAKLGLKT